MIQHFAPLYRALANRSEVTVRVFYGTRAGLDSYFDPGFGRELAWNSDLTTGYDYEFLENRRPRWPGGGFFSLPGHRVEARLSSFLPDVIFVYGYTPLLMARAIAYGVVRRRPIVMMTDSELRQRRPAMKRAAKAITLPPLFRLVDAFFTVGDCNEDYLRHYGVGPAKLVRGALTTEEAAFRSARRDRAALRSAQRRTWGIPDTDFVALFVGKLISRKRPQDLLEAVARLAGRTTRPAVALFAGDGDLRRELERRAAALPGARCRFLGLVNQRELPATYASADVLVHPSEVDPHPLTLTESALVGLPVIVSDRIGAVGPTDTAREGENARVYPVGDVRALAQILKELADDEALVTRMVGATERVANETGLNAGVIGFVKLAQRAMAARQEQTSRTRSR